MTGKEIARTAFGLAFMFAGGMHFVVPTYYRAIVPPGLPSPSLLVAVSGVGEVLGGLGLLVPRWRSAAGIGLIALLIAVFPANVEMLRQARVRDVSPGVELLLWLRLPLQAVFIWWAWRLSRPPRSATGELST